MKILSSSAFLITKLNKVAQTLLLLVKKREFAEKLSKLHKKQKQFIM